MPERPRRRTARGRILPKSKADVEAALAAVRLRTANLRLQSDKSLGNMSSAMPEQRQSSSQNRSEKEPNSGSLNSSTLQTVTKYIGELNSEHTRRMAADTPIKQTYDDSDDSSDDSYGVSGIDLQNISDMIDRVTDKKNQKNSTAIPPPKVNLNAVNRSAVGKSSVEHIPSAISSEDSEDIPNIPQNLSYMIDRAIDKKNQKKSTAIPPPKVNLNGVNLRHSSPNKTEVNVPTEENLKLIGKGGVEHIQRIPSDVSSEDSEDIPNVSSATQANLAMYIDSLNEAKKPSDPPSLPLSKEGISTLSIEMSRDESDGNINGNIYQVKMPDSINNHKNGFINTSHLRATRTNIREEKYLSQERPSISQPINSSAHSIPKSTVRISHKEESRNIQQVPSYDKEKLKSYVDKAKEIIQKESPKIAEVEYIILYARRDNVPIKPILEAFDAHYQDPTSHHSNRESPTKGLFSTANTVSTDGGFFDLDDDALDVFQNDENKNDDIISGSSKKEMKKTMKTVSAAHSSIQRFVNFLSEAVYHVESNSLSFGEISDLLDRAAHENFDGSLIRQILENPKRHVKYVEEEKETEVVVLSMDVDKIESTGRENLNLSEQALLWSNNSLNYEEGQDEHENETTNKMESEKEISSGEEEEEEEREVLAENEQPQEINPLNIVADSQDIKISMRSSVEGDHHYNQSDPRKELKNSQEDSENIDDLNSNDEQPEVNYQPISVPYTRQINTYNFSQDFEEKRDAIGIFSNGENDSVASSVPDIHSRPQTAETDNSETKATTTRPPSAAEESMSMSHTELPPGNDFELQIDSMSSDRNLNDSEKFLYDKMKHLNKAKLLASGRTRAKGGKASKPPTLTPVGAMKELLSRRMLKGLPCATIYRSSKQWKMSPNERVIGRPDYKGIHRESFHKASLVTDLIGDQDNLSWEERDTNQFFLHESDVLRANWFGTIESTRLNKRIADPVVQPQSVIMDVVTYPEKWDIDWYTTWYTKKHNPNKDEEKKKEKAIKRALREKKKKKRSKRSRRSRKYDDEDEMDEEVGISEIPEIGNLYTIRFRGEKASLVHLAYVSYLSQSRWKKKYFPKGIFAAD